MRDATLVIGGGAIGLSVAYHLAVAGVENIVLAERHQLTSGTSWHAAGIVGPLRASKNLTELAQYGIDLFSRLEQETGLSTGYQQTGGLWLAQEPSRLLELKRIAAMGKMHGLDATLLYADEIQHRVPQLYVDDLVGALWVGQDGQINPVDLCMAYAKAARIHGVDIREKVCVEAINRDGRNILSVELSSGETLKTEAVINCAGLWAREIGAMADVPLPLYPVEHIYVVSEPVSGLAKPCPIVRDLDNAIYLKGDAGRLVLGAFESNPKLWHSEGCNVDPAFIEFDQDLDHIEPMLEAGMHRVPILRDSGITRVMNGPESFTPDTRQLMGRAPSTSNFYVAAGFNSIGIMSSAGVGKAMADLVIDARPRMDLWEVDIMRIPAADNDERFLQQRIPESVHNQFAMHWPLKQYRTGRSRQCSPWHDQMAANGAVFGAPTGWERPLWFASNVEESAIRYSYENQTWWSVVQREARRLMSHGAMFELSPFSKFKIAGQGATHNLQYLCTRDVNIEPGSIIYILMLNDHGGIEMEGTLTRLADEEYLLVTGAATRQKDQDWLCRHLPDSVSVTDITEEYAVLGVMGPQSGNFLSAVGGEWLSIADFPFSTSRVMTLAETEVRASRISYVGEKGWELMVPVASANKLLEKLVDKMTAFGICFAGHLCIDACRLEKRLLALGT